MVWYSHLFKGFPQFIVIHTVKGFGIVKAPTGTHRRMVCGCQEAGSQAGLKPGEPWGCGESRDPGVTSPTSCM